MPSAATRADAVNARMDELSDRLNMVGTGAPAADVNAMNAVIADWQDFYWGNYDQWPVTELTRWESDLPLIEADMGRLESAGAGTSAPVPTTPGNQTPVPLPELTVVGTWPMWMKVAAGSILAFGLYKAARKLDLL